MERDRAEREIDSQREATSTTAGGTTRPAPVRARALATDDRGAPFDTVAEVAATVLRAPSAWISLADEQHRWFASRIGFDATRTPRDASFVACATEQPEQLLVVPDASRDHRFRHDPLVTGEPRVRFYVGAPIRAEDGRGVGSLAVVDTRPRPAGPSQDEARILQLLAHQVEQQLALVRLAADLDRTTAAVRLGEEALATERGFLGAALASLTEGIVACDAEGRLTYANAAAERLYGAPIDTRLPVASWSERHELYEADGRTPLTPERLPLLRALAGQQVREQEVVVVPPDAEARLLSCDGQAFHGPDGTLLGAVVTLRDVTERRRDEAALRHSAEHDLLTGLPNRSVFSQRLEAALAAGGDRTAVCFIDLDDFKRVNDEHGHAVGDQVLAAAAGRLDQTVKRSDTVARYGGDEFVVLLEDVAAEDVPVVVDRMHAALAAPMRIGRLLVPASATIGTAHTGADGLRDERALLRVADQRMYAAKRG